MLAIHWSPVKNSKTILRNGITKSPNGLYCFPMTGHYMLDKWWATFFNRACAMARMHYNGFIFRLIEDDMPAYYGHWIGATNRDAFEKEIMSLDELKKSYRETILWRMGAQVATSRQYDEPALIWQERDELYFSFADELLIHNSKAEKDFKNSVDFMNYTFEDYQLVLSNSIPANRIIKVVSDKNEFGKILKKDKMYKKRSSLDIE